MDPLTLALIFGGGGLLKSELIDKPNENKQRVMRSEEIRYSPWTKLAPSTVVQEANPLGTAMQAGMTGAMLGQGIENQKTSKELAQAQIGALNRGDIRAVGGVSPELSLGAPYSNSTLRAYGLPMPYTAWDR